MWYELPGWSTGETSMQSPFDIRTCRAHLERILPLLEKKVIFVMCEGKVLVKEQDELASGKARLTPPT